MTFSRPDLHRSEITLTLETLCMSKPKLPRKWQIPPELQLQKGQNPQTHLACGFPRVSHGSTASHCHHFYPCFEHLNTT
jgi:hypothetical protein